MTIETQTNRATYVGNGVATKFPFPGVLRDASSIRLFLWADNRQTEMTTGFSVVGVGSSAVYVQTAQPIPAGVKLTILRQVPYVQPMDLINGGEFSAEVIEGSDDNLELQIQQMVEMLGRAIVAPESMDKGEVTYETLIEILEDAEAARDDAQAAAESADESEAMAQKWAASALFD